MTQSSDTLILRELAKTYVEKAHDPRNADRILRNRQNNNLVPVRPLVWIDEVPWHEMDIDGQLVLHCEGEKERQMEQFFRRKLFQWKYFQADMILENMYRVNKSYTVTNRGLQFKENTLSTDHKNNIISHEYLDQLDSPEQVEKLHAPLITAHPEEDEKNMAWAQEILQDILPVRLSGTYRYNCTWDDVARYRGMEPMLMDFLAEPELTHAIAQKYYEINASVIDQMDKACLFDNSLINVHCTPAYADELDQKAAAGYEGHSQCTWFRAMAQGLSSVSPDMWEEFELNYILPLASKFALTYYGCCEPLHDRIYKLKKIPNLRKIGVSPWANVQSSAEQIEGNYVFSRKPNPAMVAGSLDEDAIRKEMRDTAQACVRYHCPCDITLKDISTVSYKPQNLIRWTEIVEDELDKFY